MARGRASASHRIRKSLCDIFLALQRGQAEGRACAGTVAAVKQLRDAAHADFRFTKKQSLSLDRAFEQRGGVPADSGAEVRPAQGGANPARRNRKRRTPTADYVRALQAKVRRRQADIKGLEEDARERESKRGKFMTNEFLVKAAIADPGTSARALERSFRECNGVDRNLISRDTIRVARAAWIETHKRMVYAVGRDIVADARHEAADQDFTLVILPFVSDAADLRMRSVLDSRPDTVSRSRSSKVQVHAVTLYAAGGRIAVPTEMEALVDKTAATLATCIERVLRDVVEGIICPSAAGVAQRAVPMMGSPASGGASLASSGAPPASSGASPASSGALPVSSCCSPAPSGALPASSGAWIWLVHVFIADGISTNEAAAKLLWAMLREKPLKPSLVFLCLLIKCMAHQANLSTGSAVKFRAAACAGSQIPGKALGESFCGAAVRLFKYLLLDYFEEFVRATHDWVDRHLEVLPWGAHSGAAVQAVQSMQKLYTKHVVSDTALRLYSLGLGRLAHVVPRDADPREARTGVVMDVVRYLTKELFVVDEKPTLSRMFTFRGCVDHCLAMHLHGVVPHCVRLKSINPRPESKKRMTKVQHVFSDPAVGQYLRRTSLALQITGGVTALVCTKDDAHCSEAKTPVGFAKGAETSRPATSGAGGGPPLPATAAKPMLVRLCLGEGMEVARTRRMDILERLGDDPDLDAGAALGVILATETDIVLRCRPLRDYPIAMCLLVRIWFPDTYSDRIMTFLRTSRAKLDVGFSLQIHRLALFERSEAAAIQWMKSGAVQDITPSTLSD